MNKKALLFSACEYISAAQYNLHGVQYDIIALEKRLKQIGFAVTVKNNAKKDEYLPAMRKLAERSPADEVHIVYFSGHGGHCNATNFICPVDFFDIYNKTGELASSGIDIKEILSVFEGRGRLILILDACRSDFGLSNGKFSEITTRENVYIAYGTQFQDTSVSVPNSLSWFTEGICDEIITPNIDVDTLFTNVRRNVYYKHGEQLPSSINSLLDVVVLHKELTPHETIETKVYNFIENQGDAYNEKYGYFRGEELVFIDAAQYFDIGLLDAFWNYDKASASKLGRQTMLSEAEDKLVHFHTLKKSPKCFYCDENYTWYYNGRQIRMGEIPPVPPSMQKMPPERGKEIEVSLKGFWQDNTLTIETNLPNGCELFINHDKVAVNLGKVIIPFEKKPESFVIDSNVFAPSQELEMCLGEKNRNICGPFVRHDIVFGNLIHWET